MRAGRLLLLASALAAAPAPVSAQTDRQVFVATVEGMTYPAALAHPDIGRLARAGGIGLLAGDRSRGRFTDPVPKGPAVTGVELSELERAVSSSRAGTVLVMVVGSAGDRPDWLALASGAPGEVLAGAGPAEGLTSDTTRRRGLVADVDVVVTVRAFLGLPVSERLPGSSIRVGGQAPTELYQRAIDYRRVATPVGLVTLALGIGTLVVGLVVLVASIEAPTVRAALAILGLFAVSLLVALVPASVLPSLEPAPAVAGLVGIAGVLTASAVLVARGRHDVAVAIVAGVGLTILVVDGLLGWPTEVTPLLGGGALLGVRFFGLGNSASGIVLSGAVLAAALLRPWAGVALLAGAALFAGLPFLGADLGGGVTLFATAGLWHGWRVRGRMDVPAWAVAGATTVLGGALLIGIHAVWPEATHVTRAVEAGGLVGTFLDRLSSNVRATAEIWPVWLTVIGLPVWLAVALGRVGPFRRLLEARPRWRTGVIVLAIGGMIGYVANDTYGTGAVAFVFVSAAMVYPALRERWTTG